MATLKIVVHAARDLPIMDSQSHLTDAYVQVKHSDQHKRTKVVMRTLNPVWDADLSFDIADYDELQEEPLEAKVWDNDKWTADDLIGTVYVDLNMVLCQDQPSLAAWMPIFDSMRGLRGELYMSLHIKFMHGGKQSNPFIPFIPRCKDGQVEQADRRTLAPSIAAQTESVLIFAVSRLDPSIYRVEKVVGMVEELALRHDPEHARLQSFSSSRKTNEQRTLQFFKASGQVRRTLARKTIEHGCNCILGYKEHYDLEPSGGNIIIRAYGTCCQVSKVVKEYATPTASVVDDGLAQSDRQHFPETTRRKRHMRNLHHLLKEATKLLTIDQLPCNVVKRVGGVVSARSIKLITQLKTKAVVQERDSWWQEIREEIKLNARSFCCNGVIGYTESTTFHEDICILSASGTAVVADWNAFTWSTQRQMRRQHNKQARKGDACQIAHIPATDTPSKLVSTREEDVVKCLWCKQKPVPAFLLGNCEIPPDLPVEGDPMLVEAHFVKRKETQNGEPLAIEVSKMLPHLEYHIHRQLVHKVQSHGFNGAFGLRVNILMGSDYVVATATATAVYIPCLPVVVHEGLLSDGDYRGIARNSVLKLNYFSVPRMSPMKRFASDGAPAPASTADGASGGGGGGGGGSGSGAGGDAGGGERPPGSPHQSQSHAASSPSVSDDDSSSTSASTDSSGSTDSSSTSEVTASSGGLFVQESGRVQPYVVDMEVAPEPVIPTSQFLVLNVGALAASPLNLRAHGSISLQRRFELTGRDPSGRDPNKRLSTFFAHMHRVLLNKVSQLANCVMASYRSEVTFASDNDIHIRLIGFLLVPRDNRAWLRESITIQLDEMAWNDNYKRSLKGNGVRQLTFTLLSCRAPDHEWSVIPKLEVHWSTGSHEFANLEVGVDRSVVLRLPHPVIVTGYRLMTDEDDEAGRDPVSWQVHGTIGGTREGHSSNLLLSDISSFDPPLERGAWTNQFTVDQDIVARMRRRTRRKSGDVSASAALGVGLGGGGGGGSFTVTAEAGNELGAANNNKSFKRRKDRGPDDSSTRLHVATGQGTGAAASPPHPSGTSLPSGSPQGRKSPRKKAMQALLKSPLGALGDPAVSGVGVPEEMHLRHCETASSQDQVWEDVATAQAADETKKKKRRSKYTKPEKWEAAYLQATSPFCLYIPDRESARNTLDEGLHHLKRADSVISPDLLGRCARQLRDHSEHGNDSHLVTVTPMDHIPGAAITNYGGFLSHHFLRETEKVHGNAYLPGGLGTFYHYQAIEAMHIMRRLVHSVNGNALLSCHMTQNVMQDSDESKAAYHFFTITGQIATVVFEPDPAHPCQT